MPTHDCPELAYAVESTTEQYVPDVFYKYKDEFGNERTQLGRPLPIEYLLIDVPSGLPKDEVLFFNKHAKEVCCFTTFSSYSLIVLKSKLDRSKE